MDQFHPQRGHIKTVDMTQTNPCRSIPPTYTILTMHSSTLLSFTLALATVQAAVLQRDIAPYPSNTPVGTVTVDPGAQASAYTEGLTLSDSDAGNDNVTADSIRLVNFDGCSNMEGVTNAEAQIYSGWQQAQKIMALQALKDGTVDFNTAGGALDLHVSLLHHHISDMRSEQLWTTSVPLGLTLHARAT